MRVKVAVAGAGYVGIANSLLLALRHDVVVYDIQKKRVDQINAGCSPVHDPLAARYFADPRSSLRATSIANEAFEGALFILIATPTDFDEALGTFNTNSVDSVVSQALAVNPDAIIVIRSTLPIGHTARLARDYPKSKIVFCPEFLREGMALRDSETPSRIVVGGPNEARAEIARLYSDSTPGANVLLTSSTEAEAIKLFSNTYLAMRVAFFNELDSFAETRGLESRDLIEGVGLDPRIGRHYSNPSFGYGGYCLPKDTKQLLSDFGSTPAELMRAIVESNATRKRHIASAILQRKPRIVGIFNLAMKSGSDNFRAASILDVISQLLAADVEVIVHEPAATSEDLPLGARLVPDLDEFKRLSDVVVANRRDSQLDDIAEKLYSRDIFGSDS